MPPLAEALKLTYDDYLDFPEDGRRHELLDGEHFMTPSPGTRHQAIVLNLALAIGNHLRREPAGRLLLAPIDVVLSNLDVVQPDLLFVSTARQSLVTERYVSGAPDLVAEVLSDTSRRRDEVTKRKLYARFGVREYWVVDPEIETVRVLHLAEDGYREAAMLSHEAGGVLSSDLLPALAIPLADIFV
jgi:Uma2 family endonuclease